jgi:hypothetical protein
MSDIVYFELNNWFRGVDYPNDEPFITWIGNDLAIRLSDDDWAKENKLCIIETLVDMSANFCITATREWVEENCPKLLTEYKEFIRVPDQHGIVEGKFGSDFLEYSEENFGVTFVEEDDY